MIKSSDLLNFLVIIYQFLSHGVYNEITSVLDNQYQAIPLHL